MPRHAGSGGQHHTKRQKGLRNRHRQGTGRYAAKRRQQGGDTYDRPALRGGGGNAT